MATLSYANTSLGTKNINRTVMQNNGMNLWPYHIQAGPMWLPLGSDTEHLTLLENFCDGLQLFQQGSVPLLMQRLILQLQTFLGTSTDSGLQNRP